MNLLQTALSREFEKSYCARCTLAVVERQNRRLLKLYCASGFPTTSLAAWFVDSTPLTLLNNPREQVWNYYYYLQTLVCGMLIYLATVFLFVSSSVACRLDLPANSTRTPDKQFFKAGESVVVGCSDGFETQGDGNLTCQSDGVNGNWDKPIPKCRGKSLCKQNLLCCIKNIAVQVLFNHNNTC